jgi:putative ABC transport system permease protein
METLWQDIKYGARMLVKSPGFTLVALVTLALGIGANTAIFSVVEAVLLRDLQYRDPERLVIIWETNVKRNRMTNVVGPANYMRWKERAQSFEKMSAFIEWDANITEAGEPEQVRAGFVAADIFETLGVQPRLGRTFGPEHAQEGSADVAVLADRYWKRRFGGDPNILGKKFSVNGRSVTVIGVMPPDFRGLMNNELFVPIPYGERHRNARGRSISVVARLKPGVTRDQAQAEMSGIARQIEQELPDFTQGWGANVVPLREQLSGQLRPALLILLGAVGFVLLIACGNVANLMLARATGRAREWAVRTALGASRGQLVRQLLTESLLLAMVGGAAGVLLGAWAVSGMQSLLPAELGRFTQVQLNPTVLVFTFVLSLLTGAIFGIAPALGTTRASSLQDTLREGTGGAGSASARHRLRGVLVVGEVALSLVLLAGAGLLLKSFAKLDSLNAGFDPEGVLTMSISLPGSAYNEAPKVIQFYDQLMSAVENLPGVASAGAMSWQLYGVGTGHRYQVVGEGPYTPGQEPAGEVRFVTPRLFEALRIPLLRGRVFTGQERRAGPYGVVVNEALAQLHWPGQDALGKRIRMEWDGMLEAEVIGVVGDVRLVGLDQKPRPTLYWAQSQIGNNFMTIMLRSQSDPALLTRAVKAEVAKLDPTIPVAKVMALEDVKARSLTPRRFSMLLLAIFAGVAVTLAAVGIYGVMAYAVSQRTREIGIRMALGAQAGDVLSLVLRGGAVIASLGLVIGLAAALGLSRFLETLLFEVSTTDPVTFAGVAVLLLGVALLACWIPARRATKVDPMVALRYE